MEQLSLRDTISEVDALQSPCATTRDSRHHMPTHETQSLQRDHRLTREKNPRYLKKFREEECLGGMGQSRKASCGAEAWAWKDEKALE